MSNWGRQRAWTSADRRVLWPSGKGKPITITWTCGACGHGATFGPDETVYEDDPRYCEHGPKAPRYPDGTLVYEPHTEVAAPGGPW